MLVFFTSVAYSAAASIGLQPCDSGLAGVGGLDSGYLTGSSDYHLLSFLIDTGAGGQRGWLDR